MSASGRIAFGMQALAAAMQVKSGRFGLRDELALARAALRFATEDPTACAEVEAFLGAHLREPVASAERLISYAQSLVPVGHRPQPAFAWQERADLQ